ncbi:MAG: hypothetical protein A2W99_15865 [Bacteroidetes bacterium GWF2_33_16]|nr:MAG: hypothetical protein A2X00_15210 [Bacteroidetes bacterium GWE2_32_14]OFY02380.1 MAG: hypothetical protein A2W99_15865 [Bacteroidetes bacterium GWF2_33_16]
MNKFEALGINQDILQGINDLGFAEPMPVQTQVIPALLEKTNDIVALAQTGTGKTAAFGLPILQQIVIADKFPQAIILSPTRELCVQIAKDLMAYSKYMKGIKILPVYGGANIDAQIRGLRMGTHIIVATPGRILDLIHRRTADISAVKTVVLDEADEMLNMGFRDDLNEILESVPKEHRTLLFSATMPREVATISKKYMSNPIEITVGNKNEGAENIKHAYYVVQARDRYLALKRIADMNPDIYGIIFCRTRMETKEVAEWLIKDGYNADALHGDLSQAQRDQVMNRFRLKNLQMLVATDVAARGLDVNDLTHVINYNLPDDMEVYTHRSGRTGRAGKAGISIAIVHLKEKYRIREIERKINKKFEVLAVPTGKEICKKQLFHLIEKMEKVEVNNELIEEFLPEVNKKLEWLERDELIKHFVSLEFNRFLEYYKNASDLNAPDEKFTEYRERDGDRRKRGERSSNRNDRSDRGDRGDSRSKDFKRLFVNIGKNQGLNPQRLMGLVNEATHEKNIPVGKIDIMKSFSFFEIDNQFVDKVMSGLNLANFDGVKVSTEIANEKPSGDSDRGERKPFGRDRERRSSDRERPERRSSDRGHSERRYSDRERPERRSSEGGERPERKTSEGGDRPLRRSSERPEWKQFDRDSTPKRSESSGKRPRTNRK